MKSLMFCTFFYTSISSSLGWSVSFGAAHISRGTWDNLTMLACQRYEFVYERGTFFSIYLKFLGKDSEVAATEIEAFIKKQADTIIIRQQIPKIALESLIDLNLDYDKISIDVKLSTNNSCEIVRVLEGTLAKEGALTMPIYNHICLKGMRCMFVMNLTDLCQVSDEKLKPQSCNVDRDLPVYRPADEDLEIRDTLIAARNFLDFVTQNNSSTSTARSNFKEVSGADNTYFTIMIVALATAAVTTILLLIIIVRQRCWINGNPRVVCLPQFSQLNENPYYENVVFRPKSEPEDEQQDPHIYDVPCVENSRE